MEQVVSRTILRRYLEKLESSLDLDVAVVGAGPSGLVCAHDLARAGARVAIFERMLEPGGGIWGGAMLFNEIVFEADAVAILDELGIRHSAAEDGLVAADAVEVASALIYRTVQTGVPIFNCVTVEDVVFKHDRVAGLVINWSPVEEQGLHVDPMVVLARAVVDASGHGAEVTARAASKADIRLDTETGDVMGERPLWVEEGERATVEASGRVYPGLYVSGMAANAVHGGFRMGPIFGGMLRSGRKVARLILDELG
jgi:thiazole biosynthesis enzyme